jgi:ribosome assembly protein 4
VLLVKALISVLAPHLLIPHHVPSKADEPVPFQFYVALPAEAVTKESSRIVIAKSIEADVLSHSSHAFSPEDILVVYCSPQSVFRVRPATRCSSSLSGSWSSSLLFVLPSSTFYTRNPSSGHSSPILCASFSPTGNLLATGSGDASARLWDLFTETPSHTLSGHKDWVLCVEWEALERKLATGGHDSHVSFFFRRARYFFECRPPISSHPQRSEYGIQRPESLLATR